MAEKFWLGNDSGNEGDLNVPANWSPSGVPTNGDDIFFNGDSVRDVTDNLDALNTHTTTQIFVQKDYTGIIGSEIAPLELKADQGSIDGGTVWLDCLSGAFPRLSQRGGTLNLAGDVAALVVSDGVCNLGISGATAIDVTQLVTQGMTANEPDDELPLSKIITLDDSSGSIGNLRLLNSEYSVDLVDGSVTTIHMGAGSLTGNGADITVVYQFGGTISLDAPATYGTFYIYVGTLLAVNDPRAKTVSTIYLYDGALMDFRNGARNQNWTTLALWGAATLYVDRNTNVDVSEF